MNDDIEDIMNEEDLASETFVEPSKDTLAATTAFWRVNKPMYEEFPIIVEAYARAKMNGGYMPLFARDKPNRTDGTKIFAVSSYESLWLMCKEGNYPSLHYYETMLPDVPCHYHVDAEYSIGPNPNINHEEVHKEFVKEVISFMKELGYISDPSEVEVVHLVSSNNKKISRHYLFKIRGKAFINNYHCGAFTRLLVKRFIKLYGPIESNPFFFWMDPDKTRAKNDPTVMTDPKKKMFYADMGIYTFRRQFRLEHMTKATNPERPMLYADEHILTNNYSIKVSSIPSIKINKSRFMNSIIQNTGYDDVLLTCLEWDGSEPKSTSDEKFFRGGKNSDLIANGNMASLAGSVSYIGDRTVALDRSTKRGRVSTEEVMVSNFPEFVYKIADMMWGHIEDGARLKPLEYYPLTGILVVSTSSRKCRLKAIHYGVPEASHKSGEKSGNCAYYVVDTKNRIWYQKCFSTKEPCKGKKTENFQIESKYTELLDRVDAERAKLIQSEESAANFLCIFEQIRRKSQSVDG